MQPRFSNGKARLKSFPALMIAMSMLGLNAAAMPSEFSEMNSQIAKKVPSAWLSCKSASECEVISYGCGGRVAINKEHIEAGEKIVYSDSIGGSAVGWCDTSSSVGVPACENFLCVVK